MSTDLIAELRSAARYAGLSLADRAADRIELLERCLLQMQNASIDLAAAPVAAPRTPVAWQLISKEGKQIGLTQRSGIAIGYANQGDQAIPLFRA